MKKHIPPEGHIGYTVPYPLFEALSPGELQAAKKGAEIFHASYPDVALFPDPFLQPVRRDRPHPLSSLEIVTGNDCLSAKVAAAVGAAIRKAWNLEIPIRNADFSDTVSAPASPLLLIGGADLNPLSMQIARKYQVGLFCGDFPGEGGWGLTTHSELESGVSLRYVLACGEETLEEAVAAFLAEAVEPSPSLTLRWVHRVSPGKKAFGFAGSFGSWLSGRAFRLPEIAEWVRSGRGQPYREIFRGFFRQEFSEALPYNAAMIDIGVDAIRYYQFTGDPEALDLFRETMWGFWDYLNDTSPRVYISDLDFRLGLLCNYWNWIEHHPSITVEERALFPTLLLGAMKMVSDYFRGRWKDRQGPHNHQTFKARTLILGWRYFQKWALPDLQRWKEDADGVFAPINPRAFKHQENANHYEMFIPEHTLVWMEVNGREISPEMRASFVQFVKRSWAMLDSFLTPLDYGDSDPKFKPERPFMLSPWLTGETGEEKELIGMERASGSMFPFEFPSPIASFPGISQGANQHDFPGPVGWSQLPLDPLLENRYPVTGEPALRFDKLIWREGWKPDSAYLAIEGFGNTGVSHAHNEVNGVLRMNLAGRIWLTSNGYGRKAVPSSDAAKAFRTRQRGPEEHNMLVVSSEQGSCETPPVNALLIDVASGPLPYAVTELTDYGGFCWRRHALHIPGAGFFFVDKVTPLAGVSGSKRVELQWNLMGERTEAVPGSGRFSFEQQGTTLIFDALETARVTCGESPIAAWKELVESGSYQFLKAIPSHCILKADRDVFESGRSHCFVSGFWLKDSVEACSWDADERLLTIDLKNGLAGSPAILDRPWGRIDIQQKAVKVGFYL